MTCLRWLRTVLLCMVILAQVPSANAQEGLILRTVYPPPNTPGFEDIARQDVYRTQQGKVFRIVHYFTTAAAEDTSVRMQVDDYGNLDYPTTFTMFFTEAFTSRSDIVKRVDKVDASDVLLGASFYISDTVFFAATPAEIDSLSDFPLRRVGYYIEQHAHVLKDQPDAYYIEGPDLTGTVLVQRVQEPVSISQTEARLISSWGTERRIGVASAAYSKRLLVHEPGGDVWICIQDQTLPNLANSEYFLVQYHYIGRTAEGPTAIAIHLRTVP